MPANVFLHRGRLIHPATIALRSARRQNFRNDEFRQHRVNDHSKATRPFTDHTYPGPLPQLLENSRLHAPFGAFLSSYKHTARNVHSERTEMPWNREMKDRGVRHHKLCVGGTVREGKFEKDIGGVDRAML